METLPTSGISSTDGNPQVVPDAASGRLLPETPEGGRIYEAIARAYIAGVLDGSTLVCNKVLLTIQRHVKDLETCHARGLYFDPAAGARFCQFVEELKPSKWPDKLVLQPWQVTHYFILYGWMKADGTRRFLTVFDMWPRKTGKSAMASAQSLYAFTADKELGPEVYAVALTKDQARRVFDECVAMVDGTSALKKKLVKLGSNPCNEMKLRGGPTSSMKPLSRDKETMEGYNISFAAGDEVHKWHTRAVYEVVRYGMRSRRQAMFLLITTAPPADDTASICNYLYEYAVKVLEGVIADDSFFCWITELDAEVKDDEGNVLIAGDAWDDETTWIKANPNLGVTVPLSAMRQEALEARNDAKNLNAFQRYSLNIRVGALDAAIPVKSWDGCARAGNPVDLRKSSLERLKGRICFAGLDLAIIDDTTALPLVFPPVYKGEVWEILPYFFIPQANIEPRVTRDRVPYDTWRDQGFLIVTPGETTDMDWVRDVFMDLTKTFDVRELVYDPALASGLIKSVLTMGFSKDKVVKFAQTAMNYAAPCGDFRRTIARKELKHDADPVLRWQISNLRWKKNHTGLIMPDKEKSVERIDGAAAAIMAFGRANHPDNAKLIQDKPRVSVL